MEYGRSITVLHVDDDPQFADLTKTMLERKCDAFEVITETNPCKVDPLLENQEIDCLISDYDMPEIDGLELLEQVRESDSTLPVILFTGKGTEEVASSAISIGVTDYLQKEGGADQFTVLANRITNAVERRINERKREQYRTVVETAGDAMYVLDENGYIELVNEAFEEISGHDRDTLVGTHVSEFMASEQVEEGTDAVRSLLRHDDRNSEMFTFRAKRPDGETRLYETTVSLINRCGFAGTVGIVRDITDERRTEKLLSGLFEQSLHGIGVKEIVTDEDGEPVDYIYQQVNNRFEKLTGLDADEVVGRRVTEVIDGIENTPFIDIFGEVALEGTTAQFEQYSEPLGRHYQVSAFSPRYGECISIFSEITERKQRQQELERYEHLIEYSPDLLVVLDEEMTVEYQSPPSPFLDWEPRNVVGENPLEHIHPDNHDTIIEHFNELIQHSNRVVTTEFRAKDAEGEWRWIESRGQNFIGDDPIDGIFVVMREVTDRKLQERQLAHYGETLEQLQETTQTLLETTDAKTAANRVIESFETIFEYNITGIWLQADDRRALEPIATSKRGKELISDLPTYTPEKQSLSWQAYKEQELRYIREMSTHETRRNPDTPIESEVIVPLDEYGLLNIGATEPAAFTEREVTLIELWAETLTVVLSRITEFERLQEREVALKRERDRLDEFASVISHDLQSPLSVATGRAELAAAECDSEHLVDVMQSLTRMKELLDDTLTLARDGNIVGETDQVDLKEVFETCWKSVSTANASLKIEETATIQADRSRLIEALENLVRNAVTHGTDSVTISVGLTDDADGFYVADDGPGIPEDEHSQVFKSGFTTTQEGTGLGLAIVKRICEAHGWKIAVSESESGGARFDITGVECAG